MSETTTSNQTRKKFLIWTGLSFLSLALIRFTTGKKKQQETVKLLTREGRLVEVDKRFLEKSRQKISDSELKSWVNRH